MRLILFGMLLTLSLSGTACAASGWQTMSFDGHRFVGGSGNGSVLLKDGYLPLPASAAVQREDQLPKKNGAIATFCYLQTSGGKLRKLPSVSPIEGLAVTISNGSLTVVGRTDVSGYFILALPRGTYDVSVLGFSKKVVVESGKTALAAFRAGKRMVD